MANKRVNSSVIVLIGSESLLISRKLEDIKSSAGVEGSDAFDLLEFNGAFDTPQVVIDATLTVPFIAEKRVIVYSNAHRLDKLALDELAKLFTTVPNTSILVVLIEDDGTDKRRTEKLEEFCKNATKAGMVIRCAADTDTSKRMIEEEATQLGVRMQPAAANILLELTAGSVTEAISELTKCAFRVGKGGVITSQLVREVAIPTPEYKVFSLTEALIRGDLRNSLEQLRTLTCEESKVTDAAMQQLFPQLMQNLRSIWQARSLVEARDLSSDRIFTQNRSLATIHQFARKKAEAAARSVTLDKVRLIIRKVVEAELRLKGRLPTSSPTEALERMVLEICAISSTSKAT